MIKNFPVYKKELMKTNVKQAAEQQTKVHTILKRNVERVQNIDEKVVELVLKSENIKIQPTAGFLIEVFASGSDGKLTRLFQDDLVDLYGNVLEEGFLRYLTMEIDSK